MVRQAIIFAAVALSASAQMYGGYGPYGGPEVMPFEPMTPPPEVIVMPIAPSPEAEVMPIAPSPEAEVMPIAPSPEAEVMPIAPSPMSTLEGCLIDHGFGCEQCMDGFYKVGDAAAPTCAPCDFDGCSFCNDFVGCAQCELGYFIVMGDEYQECATCAGSGTAGFSMGCTPEQVAA